LFISLNLAHLGKSTHERNKTVLNTGWYYAIIKILPLAVISEEYNNTTLLKLISKFQVSHIIIHIHTSLLTNVYTNVHIVN